MWPLLLAWMMAGCAVFRPVGDSIETHYRAAPSAVADPSDRCLLVFLPGIGDSPRRFEHGGFLAEVRRASSGCDAALVDAHFTYYVTQQAVTRISTDVLRDARERGYARVWLVGVSIGGYGAMLTARAHPELVDGVVLLAPMIGVPPNEDNVEREVRAHGGLLAWSGLDGVPSPPHHFRDPRLVWEWLRDSAADPRRANRVVLAYGTEDRRASRYDLVATALPRAQVFRASGAHDWPTWRLLWRQIVRAEPWRERPVPDDTGHAVATMTMK